MERFLAVYDYLETGNIPARIGEAKMESELRVAMTELGAAKPEAIVKNLPVTLDTLLRVMVQPPSISGHVLSVGHTTFEALCLLLNKISVSI